MANSSDSWPRYHKNVTYSQESSLNTLDICIPGPHTATDAKRLWIVFIHGGAWRDPDISSNSFRKTQELLLKSPSAKHIAAFASLNYRLSPYPSHPTHPSSPDDAARSAKHPDHINDVLAALLYLQKRYSFVDRYILAGHSCGATLALQVAIKRSWGPDYGATLASELKVVPPSAIVGIECLYDLPALVEHHKHEPVYQQFVENAFGLSHEDWKAASPAYADFAHSWRDGNLVVLAHSREDELVEWAQVEGMEEALKAQDWKRSGERRVEMVELRGKHDDVWKMGRECGRAIAIALESTAKTL